MHHFKFLFKVEIKKIESCPLNWYLRCVERFPSLSFFVFLKGISKGVASLEWVQHGQTLCNVQRSAQVQLKLWPSLRGW